MVIGSIDFILFDCHITGRDIFIDQLINDLPIHIDQRYCAFAIFVVDGNDLIFICTEVFGIFDLTEKDRIRKSSFVKDKAIDPFTFLVRISPGINHFFHLFYPYLYFRIW